MSTKKSKALELAAYFDGFFISEEVHAGKAQETAAELRRLHARVVELEANLKRATLALNGDLSNHEVKHWYLKDVEASEHYGKDVYVYYSKSDFKDGVNPCDLFEGLEALYTASQLARSLADPQGQPSTSSTAGTGMDFAVMPSPLHGLGCFAARDFSAGECVTSSVLVFPKEDLEAIVAHTFPWGRGEESVVLSELSYCNAANDPNLKILSIDKVRRTKTFVFTRDVREGEEITLKYLVTH